MNLAGKGRVLWSRNGDKWTGLKYSGDVERCALSVARVWFDWRCRRRHRASDDEFQSSLSRFAPHWRSEGDDSRWSEGCDLLSIWHRTPTVGSGCRSDESSAYRRHHAVNCSKLCCYADYFIARRLGDRFDEISWFYKQQLTEGKKTLHQAALCT